VWDDSCHHGTGVHIGNPRSRLGHHLTSIWNETLLYVMGLRNAVQSIPLH
jgi:hypothetical protein